MKTLTEYINEGMTNPTAMAKTIKTWIMECMTGNDDKSFNQAGRMTDAIITGLRQGIHEYEKKYPNDAKTLGFFKEITRNLVNSYEKSF